MMKVRLTGLWRSGVLPVSIKGHAGNQPTELSGMRMCWELGLETTWDYTGKKSWLICVEICFEVLIKVSVIQDYYNYKWTKTTS